MSIYFVFVLLAALLDILANLMLKQSFGFQKRFLGIVSILLALGAFGFLSLAIEKIPLSVAYFTWGAIGIIGTILGGYLFFKERLNLIGYIGVALLGSAVVLLHMD